MSLTQKILISLISGVALGYFLDYPITGAELIGKSFVMLLQMTAIPYICVSLICGIGFLEKNTAIKLVQYGVIIYVILTAIMLYFIFLSDLAFPNWQSASFYSPNPRIPTEGNDLLSLFIPSNPFSSLANTHVPAIVLFCVFLGIGFMSVEYRNQSLLFFKDIQQSIVNVNNLILKLAPLGVFCIAQHAAASLDKEHIDGLLVYIVITGFLACLLSFVVLPGLVAIFTPFTYRQILSVSKEAILTAFVTGHILVVLPMIAERAKRLINEYTGADQTEHNLAEVIAPISFSIPTGSKLLSLSFIVFAAWFDGQPLASSDYALVSLLGVAYMFNSNYGAIPDLLHDFHITSGLFDLFVIGENLIVRHLGGIVGAMFCVTLTLLTTVACAGIWRVNLKKAAIVPLVTLVITSTLLFTISRGFEVISHQYQGYAKFIDRGLMYAPVDFKVVKEPPEKIPVELNADTFERIKERGFIRFGYYQDSLPLAFNNKQAQLVGLDVELIHLLAREMRVGIEFVKVTHAETGLLLKSGYLDLASGMPMIAENLATFALSIPYTYERMAFVVKNEKRHEFKDLNQFQHKEGITIGIPGSLFYQEVINQKFPKANIEVLASPRRFFSEKSESIDAMVFGAAGASAWTLVYPDYSVVTPKQELTNIPISFAIPPRDPAFELYLRNWITLNQNNGNIQKIFEYWIEGKS